MWTRAFSSPGIAARALAAAAMLSASAAAPALEVEVSDLSTPAHMQVLQRLRAARSTGTFRLYEAGRSAAGAPIPLVVLSPVETDVLPPVRIFIICSQHGDEPAAKDAMLRLIDHCSARQAPASLLSPDIAAASNLSALDRVLWLIVPMANPDGLDAGSRLNARRVDLNRDWIQRTQPETRAIKGVFDRWQPQVVMDLHQWSPDDPPPAGNGLELSHRPQSPLQQMEHELARAAMAAGAGADMDLIASGPGANPSLAHRYFAGRGAVSYLLETAAGATPAERERVLLNTVLTLSHYAGKTGSVRWEQAVSAGAAWRYPAEYERWFEARRQSVPLLSRPASPAVFWGVMGIWALAALARFAPDPRRASPATRARGRLVRPQPRLARALRHTERDTARRIRQRAY